MNTYRTMRRERNKALSKFLSKCNPYQITTATLLEDTEVGHQDILKNEIKIHKLQLEVKVPIYSMNNAFVMSLDTFVCSIHCVMRTYIFFLYSSPLSDRPMLYYYN